MRSQSVFTVERCDWLTRSPHRIFTCYAGGQSELQSRLTRRLVHRTRTRVVRILRKQKAVFPSQWTLNVPPNLSYSLLLNLELSRNDQINSCNDSAGIFDEICSPEIIEDSMCPGEWSEVIFLWCSKIKISVLFHRAHLEF